MVYIHWLRANWYLFLIKWIETSSVECAQSLRYDAYIRIRIWQMHLLDALEQELSVFVCLFGNVYL